MAIDLQQSFSSAGKPLIELLSHCVFSVNMDAMFLYLVREYQFQPRAVGAVALYDVFCNTNSPGRISVSSAIPNINGILGRDIDHMRRLIQAAEASRHATNQPQSADQIGTDVDGDQQQDPNEATRDGSTVIPMPPRYLFDSIAGQVSGGASEKIARLKSHYDPNLSARENLPGGKMTPAQIAFLNHTWVPQLRPCLVSAGYWRIATIG